jgi:N utilization substance protein A
MELELNKIIEQVSKDKGLEKSVLIEALELAMLTAAKKKLGQDKELEAHYNPEKCEVELFEFKTVVSKVENPGVEIEFEKARVLDPECELDDTLGVKLNSQELGRISAQTAKQVIVQKVRDAERNVTYQEYETRKGQVISGIVRRHERRDIIVDIGRTEAILPFANQIQKERYRIADRVQGIILDVERISRGPQIILSRTDSQFLIKLFEAEVPEIGDGIIRIHCAAREPGDRAKIAVSSKDSDIDPVGACVGIRGSRVQNVVQELKGERIDIIMYSADPVKFVCNALGSSIEVTKVVLDEKAKLMDIVVPDDLLSLAIGKRGQNVRLASQLTGWDIDIRSESQIKELAEEMKLNLEGLEGFDSDLVGLMVKHGIVKYSDFLTMDESELSEILGIGEKRVDTMKASLSTYLEKRKREIEENKLKPKVESAAAELPSEPADAKAVSEETLLESVSDASPTEAKENAQEEDSTPNDHKDL